MGMSNKDRQAAFKERMRQEGKVMRTLWLDPGQDTAIKGWIAGEQLPVTVVPDQGLLLTRVEELEAMNRELSNQVQAARDLERQARQESDSLREKHQLAARDMSRLNTLLKTAQKALATNEVNARPPIALSAPDTSKRAKILLEKIDTIKTWQGDKRERDAFGTRQASERLAGLVRQTKAARTAILKAEQELADVVTDDEKEALGLARQALSQILASADLAKEQGRRLAKRREEHEGACRAAAHKAVAETFQPESIEDQIVLIMAPGKPESYTSAYDLASGVAFKRTHRDAWGKEHNQDILANTLADAVRETLESLKSRVCKAIKQPAEAQEKAMEIRNEMETKRPAVRAEHDQLIHRIQAELVARRLEKANTP